jgi:hypothetical protein
MNTASQPLEAETAAVNRPNGKRAARTIDAGTGTVVPLQRTPLNNLENVKRELARVYRRVKAGELPSEEGSKRAYILSTLGKIIEAADLERRLEALERANLLPSPTPEADE